VHGSQTVVNGGRKNVKRLSAVDEDSIEERATYLAINKLHHQEGTATG